MAPSVAGVVARAVAGSPPRHRLRTVARVIRESRHVEAPGDVVHCLLTDVSSWPLWSPHVLRTDPADGSVTPGWRGRVRPWFGPATTMEVTDVTPGGGFAWHTRALGHQLRYVHTVRPSTAGGCDVEFTAEVSGPAGDLVERAAAPLSAFGQRRRLQRLGLLAERLSRG